MNYDEIEEGIYHNPLLFLNASPSLQSFIAQQFPFSIGIEIETPPIDSNYQDLVIKSVPFLMNSHIGTYEQNFRIPAGVCGLISLYFISQELNGYFIENIDSGIHYHIDHTDSFDIVRYNLIKYSDYILSELDTWDYKGSYNRREVSASMSHCWVRSQSGFRTFECRIGEMTFDYTLLVKRIHHLNRIFKHIRKELGVYKLNCGENLCKPDHLKVIEYLRLESEVDRLEILDEQDTKDIFDNYIANRRKSAYE